MVWTSADWQNPDAQLYWENYMEEPMNDYTAMNDYTDEDKKVLDAAGTYDTARAKLLGREGDVEELWRTITAADAFRRAVGG